MSPERIEVHTVVRASGSTVWRCFTEPAHIQAWNHATDDWYCPAASNDLRVGGSFRYTMASRDGSESFDFGGTYTEVVPQTLIRYALEDGRTVDVHFTPQPGGSTRVTETFDPEQINAVALQMAGWQAILDTFRAHVESQA